MKRLIAIAIAVVLLATMLPLASVSAGGDSEDQSSEGLGCKFYTRQYAYSSSVSDYSYIQAYAYLKVKSGYTWSVYCYTSIDVYTEGDTLFAKDTTANGRAVYDEDSWSCDVAGYIHARHHAKTVGNTYCMDWYGGVVCQGGSVTFSGLL